MKFSEQNKWEGPFTGKVTLLFERQLGEAVSKVARLHGSKLL